MSHSNFSKVLILYLLSFLFTLPSLSAQQQVMTPVVYEEWYTIKKTQISNNGRWVVYEENREKLDGQLKVYDTKKDKQLNFDRTHKARLSEDSHYLTCFIYPSRDSIRNMKRNKVKEKDLPGDTLFIYNLEKKGAVHIPEVKDFKMPIKWNGWIVYQLEVNKETDTTKVVVDSTSVALKKENKETGTKLVLYELATGKKFIYPFVKEFILAKEGPKILFSSTGDEVDFSPGIYLFDATQKKLHALFRHKGDYSQLSFSDNGQQAAFIANLDTTDMRIKPFQLFYHESGLGEEASLIAAPKDKFLPKDWGISPHYKPTFAKDGSKLFFGIAPPPFLPDTTLLDDEIVKVEVWHYEDARLQSQQNKTLEKDKKKSYLTAWFPQTGNFQKLAKESLAETRIGNDGISDNILAFDEQPYLKTSSWDGFPVPKDIYVLNAKTGRKQLLGLNLRCSPSLSPGGNYVSWFSYPDTAWYAYSIASNSILQLTNNNTNSFYNELHDTPGLPGSYGITGWSQNDDFIYINDRYDIWKIDPKRKTTPQNLTNGRENKTSYRYIKLDPEKRFINSSETILLYAFNETDKSSGYVELDLKKGKIKTLVMDDYQFNRRPLKARDKDKYVYTKENFQTFPDLWYHNGNIKKSKRISNTNPQQSKYKWGNISLYSWKDDKGIDHTGMLVKPAGFDPTKQYPMIVNFYERSSNRLHSHPAPYPHRSTINYSFYANQGYLIFNPDIRYTTGSPGDNALQGVLSGVNSLIAKGFVDKDYIGLQGHSWGGYQIAHIVTKTAIFACAESGAPVVNMFSAYGGIRWRSGRSRMFQYENTQSRIGGTIWEKPELYKANSPLFELDKVTTPVLILHNDKDGAVPWYQGIEFFVAMRRLNKPAWLLNYNDEPHWPTKRQNRIDFQGRMLQFFDHYLKGKPMPDWMREGVRAVERESVNE